MGNSDIVDVLVTLHHQTADAFLVSLDGVKANAVWVPKSEVEMERQPGANIWLLTAPEWLAIDKRLV